LSGSSSGPESLIFPSSSNISSNSCSVGGTIEREERGHSNTV